MKLFKKVLAVALVGAMAVSMLTACGSSKSSKVKDALKDFDIKMDAAMVQDTEKMMGGLQQLTEKVTSGAVKLNDETQMKKISEKFGEMTDYTFSSSTGKGDYDLYIWTNGADGRPASGGKTERYPYLMKVQNVHVSEKNLPRLLDKEFIQKGEFSGNSEASTSAPTSSLTSTRARRKWSKREGEKLRLLSFFIPLLQDPGCSRRCR